MRTVMRVLGGLVALLSVWTFARPAGACSCDWQPAELVFGAPLVLSIPDQPPIVELSRDGHSVAAKLVWLSPETAQLCARRWMILDTGPSGSLDVRLTGTTPNGFQLIEVDRSPARAPVFANAEISASIAWVDTPVERLESGMCHAPPLAGELSVGFVEIQLSASRPVPLFLEVSTEDERFGSITSVGSTLTRASGAWRASDRLRADVVRLPTSSACVEIRLLDGAGTERIAERVCRTAQPVSLLNRELQALPVWEQKTDSQESVVGCSTATVRAPGEIDEIGSLFAILLILARLDMRRRKV